MEISFEGRNVVVTGGLGALGRAVAELLVQAGAFCYLPVRKKDPLGSFGGRREGVRLLQPVDLLDPVSVSDFYASIPQLWASIHCAGGYAMAPFSETDLESFLSQIQLNTVTCFNCCREAVRSFQRSGTAGRIVNVAARPAMEPRLGAGMVGYTVSKSAVAALTVALGEELASSGILVNAVAPSILDTPANRAAMPGAEAGRWPTVEEAAATICFLASPQNRATRSSIVSVSGRS